LAGAGLLTRVQPAPAQGSGATLNTPLPREGLNAWIETVHRAGIQANCHANRDVAIRMYLSGFERAQTLSSRPDARLKITHCTLMDDELIGRRKAANAAPAFFTTYAYYNGFRRVMPYLCLRFGVVVSQRDSDKSQQ